MLGGKLGKGVNKVFLQKPFCCN